MKENQIYSKVFTWFFIGLMITFVSGYCLSLNEILLYRVLSIGMLPMIIIELVIAVLMGFRIQKMNPLTAKICFILYSIITGITFGVIFIEYQLLSIIAVFLATSVIFGVLAFIGYITKKDMTRLGTLLFATLLGCLVISLFNIFLFQSSQLELVLSVIFLVLFMIYVMYDMKNIRYLVNQMEEDNAAIYGAFQLYLDFINIFIRLLDFFGNSKD